MATQRPAEADGLAVAAGGAGGDDRGERRRTADERDALEELPACDAALHHVADQSLLEIDARSIVPFVHVVTSSSAGAASRTSASAGGQTMSTSLPIWCRSPDFGASTVMARPPRVRTWYWTVPPR